jgi:hypothetical protein
MKKILVVICLALLPSCAVIDSVKQYWPRDHDPVLFNQLVTLDIELTYINCEKPDWVKAKAVAEHVERYTAWRKDPQHTNLEGLHKHIERMSQGGSKAFCELGKKTALQRIDAARSAWGGR